MRVCGLEFTSDTIHRIGQRLEETPSVSKRSLARCVCEWMNWIADSGRPKETACRKALTVLDERGIIDLPQFRGSNGHNGNVRAQQTASFQCADVACDLNEFGPVEIEMV